MTRTVVIPDTHVPFHDRAAWRKLLKYCEDTSPEAVVLLGDFMDFHALSQHRKNEQWLDNLKREINAGKKGLAQLRAANPKAEIRYIEGNHELRWSTYFLNKAPVMRLLNMGWETALDLAALDIKLQRPNKPTWIPAGAGERVAAYHGHEMKGSLTKPAAHALRMAENLGYNVHIGHGHKMGLLVGKSGNKEVFGAEGGSLVQRKSIGFDYLGNKVVPWWVGWQVYDSRRKQPYPEFVRA